VPEYRLRKGTVLRGSLKSTSEVCGQRGVPLASKLDNGYAGEMATTLRDFIAQRETEIRDQQKALKAELRELQIAKAALDGQVDAPANGATPTIKEMAREVLSGMPNGLNSSGILDGIKKTFGREIERTSLSPQLSRLKDDGDLVLNGELWFTAAHWKAWSESWGTDAPLQPNTKPIEARMDENPFAEQRFSEHNPFEEDDTPF
jgi:hypothetical protein